MPDYDQSRQSFNASSEALSRRGLVATGMALLASETTGFRLRLSRELSDFSRTARLTLRCVLADKLLSSSRSLVSL